MYLTTSNGTELKKRYGPGKNHGTQNAKGAKASDSSNGRVASDQKSKVAPKKKPNWNSSCRSADSCANKQKVLEYSGMYLSFFVSSIVMLRNTVALLSSFICVTNNVSILFHSLCTQTQVNLTKSFSTSICLQKICVDTVETERSKV